MDFRRNMWTAGGLTASAGLAILGHFLCPFEIGFTTTELPDIREPIPEPPQPLEPDPPFCYANGTVVNVGVINAAPVEFSPLPAWWQYSHAHWIVLILLFLYLLFCAAAFFRYISRAIIRLESICRACTLAQNTSSVYTNLRLVVDFAALSIPQLGVLIHQPTVEFWKLPILVMVSFAIAVVQTRQQHLIERAQAQETARRENLLAAAEQANSNLQDSLSKKDGTIQQLEKKIEGMKNDEEKESTKMQQLTKEHSASEKKASEMETSIGELNAKIKELEEAATTKDQELGDKETAMRKLSSDNGRLEQEGTARKSSIEKLQTENETLRHTAVGKQKTMEESEAAMRKLSEDIDRVQEESNEHKVSAEKLQTEIETLKQTVTDREQSLEQNDSAMKGLEKEKTDLQDELSKNKDVLKQIETEKKSLEQTVASKKQLLSEKESAMNEASEENTRLQDEVSKKEEAIKQLRTKIEDLENIVAEKKRLQEKNDVMLQEVLGENDDLKDTNASKQKSLEEKETKIQQLSQQNGKLQDTISSKDSLAEQLQAKIASLENAVADKDRSLSVKNSELQKIGEEKSSLQDAVSKKDTQIKQLQSESLAQKDIASKKEQKIQQLSSLTKGYQALFEHDRIMMHLSVAPLRQSQEQDDVESAQEGVPEVEEVADEESHVEGKEAAPSSGESSQQPMVDDNKSDHGNEEAVQPQRFAFDRANMTVNNMFANASLMIPSKVSRPGRQSYHDRALRGLRSKTPVRNNGHAEVAINLNDPVEIPKRPEGSQNLLFGGDKFEKQEFTSDPASEYKAFRSLHNFNNANAPAQGEVYGFNLGNSQPASPLLPFGGPNVFEQNRLRQILSVKPTDAVTMEANKCPQPTTPQPKQQSLTQALAQAGVNIAQASSGTDSSTTAAPAANGQRKFDLNFSSSASPVEFTGRKEAASTGLNAEAASFTPPGGSKSPTVNTNGTAPTTVPQTPVGNAIGSSNGMNSSMHAPPTTAVAQPAETNTAQPSNGMWDSMHAVTEPETPAPAHSRPRGVCYAKPNVRCRNGDACVGDPSEYNERGHFLPLNRMHKYGGEDKNDEQTLKSRAKGMNLCYKCYREYRAQLPFRQREMR